MSDAASVGAIRDAGSIAHIVMASGMLPLGYAVCVSAGKSDFVTTVITRKFGAS